MGGASSAHNPHLGRPVAMEVQSPRLVATPWLHSGFERAARRIPHLGHPHVRTLHDVGHPDLAIDLVPVLQPGRRSPCRQSSAVAHPDVKGVDMNRVIRIISAAAIAIASVAMSVWGQSGESPKGPPPPPPARAIPGLNAPDPHPNGCVDCHVNMKEYNLDVRLTTLMDKWTQGVEPRLLAVAKAAAPDSTKIVGRHPKTSAARGEVPSSCLSCHGRNSTKAPPFARMLHLIHLTGGDSNPYMGYYQGDCTHCHKLDQRTGRWGIPSAKEPTAN